MLFYSTMLVCQPQRSRRRLLATIGMLVFAIAASRHITTVVSFSFPFSIPVLAPSPFHPITTTMTTATPAPAAATATSSITTNTNIRHRLLASPIGATDEDAHDEDERGASEVEDFTGKTIFQRTFYRLTTESQVQRQHAIMLEERLRFESDTNNEGYLLPIGPRTLILREGSGDDEITDELFRLDIFAPNGDTDTDAVGTTDNNDAGRGGSPHNGSGSFDTEIATILYVASNPTWIQGDVLELSSGGTSCGVVGLLGCIAAKFASMTSHDVEHYKAQRTVVLQQQEHEELSLLSSAHKERRDHFVDLVPQRMHHLTLSDDTPEALRRVTELYQRHFEDTNTQHQPIVSMKHIDWKYPRPAQQMIGGRRFDYEYRTILGSDLDLSFPVAKELSKSVANMLLPSDEFAVATIKEGAETAPSFGALGMIDSEQSQVASSLSSSSSSSVKKDVDPSIAPQFIHVSPDYRDEVRYLRQFLEKGYRMNVRSNYINMERLEFQYQTLPPGSNNESEIEDLDTLELKHDSNKDYQSVVAIHHPDYAGDGSGEYFFPMETGTYEGGMGSSLEPKRWKE